MQGPVASSDLSTREKLDRPIISVYQRHPGTNLPEAQEIVKVGLYDNNTPEVIFKKICFLKKKSQHPVFGLSDIFKGIFIF